MYDVHRLRLLRELRNRGSLAAVARAHGYNASTISHQLAILEREVGVPVVEPYGRGVRLTDAGMTLAEHADRILLELDRAEAAVASMSNTVSGHVRLAAFQTAAHVIVPKVAALVQSQWPQVHISFSQVLASQALPALLARDFDVVICEEYPGNPIERTAGVTLSMLLDDDMFLASPTRGARLADLADAEWAMEPHGTRARTWSVAMCRDAGFEPRVTFDTPDVLVHQRLVELGLVSAFLPALVLEAGHPFTATGVSRRISVAVRDGTETNPAQRAVVDALREVSLGD